MELELGVRTGSRLHRRNRCKGPSRSAESATNELPALGAVPILSD